MRKRPPFRALEVFDAVARHQSFSGAAKELCVSQSAVSHQIKLLEQYFQEDLINRNGAFSLTNRGQVLFEQLEGILDDMGALNHIFSDESKKTIRVACNTCFATKILMPSLHDFNRKHPNINVEIVMMTVLFYKLTSEFADIYLTCNSNQRGYEFNLLEDEMVVPYCSTSIASSPDEVTAENISNWKLIDTDHEINFTNWSHWSAANNIPINKDNIFISLGQVAIAIEAATSGLGIGLAWRPFIEKDIQENKLMELSLPSYRSGIGYYVAHANNTEDRAILSFKNWMLEKFSDKD